MMTKYYVFYLYEVANTPFWGSQIIGQDMGNKITGSLIIKIEEYIRKSNEYQKVVIQNIIKLEE